jgi:acetyltransferase-like isoleucine patch superfamily enzyme
VAKNLSNIFNFDFNPGIEIATKVIGFESAVVRPDVRAGRIAAKNDDATP